MRRFESCWGRHPLTSGNSDLTSHNGQSRGLPSAARMRQETPRSDVFRPPYAPKMSASVAGHRERMRAMAGFAEPEPGAACYRSIFDALRPLTAGGLRSARRASRREAGAQRRRRALPPGTGDRRCRIGPFCRSRRRLRRRWPGVSAPGSALRRPARAHAGPHQAEPQIQAARTSRARCTTQLFPRPAIIQLAATASRALPAVASHAIGSADPRPGVHSQGFGAYRGRSQRSRIRPGPATRRRWR